jgi:hypothetical protein
MVIKAVKLIDSNQYIFENKPYGPVDVRTLESETEEEKQAALESLNSFNYATDGKNILRLVTIIEGKTLKRAIIDSELLFEETIDLLKRQFITRIKECDGAGYWVNMDTGETMPFFKPHEQENLFLNQVFQTSLGPYSPMFGEQMFSSNRSIEAIEAFIRSIHWYNNSNSQARIYLKFLYKWIAIETIAKISFDEDIIPKLCLVLGFPLSKHLKSIQRQDMEKWTSIMGYKNYKNIIKKELYKCKKIRNDIVHSGFKETNLINENMELKLYIIDSTYSCMTNTIEKIIISGRNTIKDVWDVMCEYIMQDQSLMHWISGTFLNQVNVFVADSGATHDDELFQ